MNEPVGNTLGLKPSELEHLKRTWRRRVQPDELVSPELASHLADFSRQTNRQVGVLLSRKGEVEAVVVGDAHKLELPDIGRARAGQVRLRGLRLVHTHLKSEPLTRDDLTDLALLRLDAVAAVGVKEDGTAGRAALGAPAAGERRERPLAGGVVAHGARRAAGLRRDAGVAGGRDDARRRGPHRHREGARGAGGGVPGRPARGVRSLAARAQGAGAHRRRGGGGRAAADAPRGRPRTSSAAASWTTQPARACS